MAETIGINLVFTAITRSAEAGLRNMKSGLNEASRAHVTLELADSRSEKQAKRSAVAFSLEAQAIEQVGDESLKTAAKQKVMQDSADRTTKKVDTLADAVGGRGGGGRQGLRRAVFDANQAFSLFGNIVNIIKWPAIISAIGLAAQAISALGAGVVALSASLGSAIGALGALVPVLGSVSGALVAYPAILGAAAQGFGTFVLAFGGLKDAMKEQQTGVSAVAQAQLGAQGATLSYQQALKAQADALQTSGASSLEYQQATLAVTQAQQQATVAEKALAEARQASNAQIQAFAKFIDTEAKPKLKEIQAIAAQGILPDLTTAGRQLLSGPVFGAVKTAVSRQSRSIGEEIARAVGSFNNKGFASDLSKIFANNTDMLRGFTRGATGLAHALTDILVAARPLTSWFGQLAERFGEWTQNEVRAARESGKLTQFFEHTRQTLSKLGQIIGNVGEALFRTFSRGNKLGDSMLDGLVKITKQWADWTNSVGGRFKIDAFFERSAKNARIWGKTVVDLIVALNNIFKGAQSPGQTLAQGLANAAAQFRHFTETTKGRNSVRKWFEDAIPPLQALGKLAEAILFSFGRLANNKGLAALIDQIRTGLLPAIEQLIDGMNKSFGPALVDAITKIIQLFGDLTSGSGALTVFVQTIGTLADALHKIINVAPPLKSALTTIIASFVALKALKLGAGALGFTAIGSLLGIGGRGGAAGRGAAAAGRGGGVATAERFLPAVLTALGLSRPGSGPDRGRRRGGGPNLGTFDGFTPVGLGGTAERVGPLRRIIGGARFRAGALGIGAGLVGAGLQATVGGRVGSIGSSVATGAALGATVGSVIPGVGTGFGAAIGAAGGLALAFHRLKDASAELAKRFRGDAAKADFRVRDARQTIGQLRESRPDAVLQVRQAQLDVSASRRAAAEGRIAGVSAQQQAQLNQNVAQSVRNLTVAKKQLADIDKQLENQTKRVNTETGKYWQTLQNVAGQAGKGANDVHKMLGPVADLNRQFSRKAGVEAYVRELSKIKNSTGDKRLKEIASAAVALANSLKRIPKKVEISVFLNRFVRGPGVIPDSRGENRPSPGAIDARNSKRAGKSFVDAINDAMAFATKTAKDAVAEGKKRRAKADAEAAAAADARQRAAAAAAQRAAAAQAAAVRRAIARPVFTKGQLAKMTGEQLAGAATRLTQQIKELRQGGVTPEERINVARFTRALKIVNERIGKWMQARTAEIEKMSNKLQDRIAARQARAESFGPLGAGAQAVLEGVNARDTQQTLAAERKKAERELRVARLTHNQPQINAANATLRGIRQQGLQAQGAATAARRDTAVAAEDRGFRMLQIRQEIAGRADTPAAGAERAAFIRRNVIPRLTNELKETKEERQKAVREGNLALARILKAEIGDKQLEIAEAQLNAQQQIQKNTQVMSNAQQLSFEFGGQRTTDLLTQGTGT